METLPRTGRYVGRIKYAECLSNGGGEGKGQRVREVGEDTSSEDISSSECSRRIRERVNIAAIESCMMQTSDTSARKDDAR